MKKIHHVMLDLETLGLKPGCRILSIGACKFQLEENEPSHFFSLSVDPSTQHLLDEAYPETVAWWSRQSEEARAAVFNNPAAVNIYVALSRFVDWLERLRNFNLSEEIYIWGNGATFDEPIILEALKRYDLPIPWTFRGAMCFRTLKELGRTLGIEEPQFVGTKHNALSDAVHQAKWADSILNRITNSGRPWNEKHL